MAARRGRRYNFGNYRRKADVSAGKNTCMGQAEDHRAAGGWEARDAAMEAQTNRAGTVLLLQAGNGSCTGDSLPGAAGGVAAPTAADAKPALTAAAPFALPAPSHLRAQLPLADTAPARQVAYDTVGTFLHGNEFLPALPHNRAAVDALKVSLTPDWSGPARIRWMVQRIASTTSTCRITTAQGRCSSTGRWIR